MKINKIDRRIASYIVFGVTAVIVILTFFGATREFLYGIFGYVVYAYIPAALAVGFLLYSGKKLSVPKKKAALYTALFFSAILTIHIACSKELVGEANYLTATYAGHTAGGALIGLPAALLHLIFPNYAFMLVVALLLTAALLFAAIYPFVVNLGRNGEKKPAKAPFARQKEGIDARPHSEPPFETGRRDNAEEGYFSKPAAPDSDVVDVTGMSDEEFIGNYAPSTRSRSQAESILFEKESEEEKQSRFGKAFDIRPYTKQGMTDMLPSEETLFATPVKEEPAAREVPPAPQAPEAPKSALDMLYTPVSREEDLTSYRPKEAPARPLNPVMPAKRLDQYGFEIPDEPAPKAESASPKEAPAYSESRDFTRRESVKAGTEYGYDARTEAPSVPGTEERISEENRFKAPEQQKTVAQTPIYATQAPQSAPKNRLPDGVSGKDWLMTPVSPDEFRNSGIFSSVLNEKQSVTAAIDEKYGEPAEAKVYTVPEPTPQAREVTEVRPVPVREKKPEFHSETMRRQDKPEFPPVKGTQQSLFGQKVAPKAEPKSEPAPEPKPEPEPPKKYIPKPYKAPPFDLLKDYGNSSGGTFPPDYQELKEKIETTMHEFSVPAEVVTAKRGPSFTTYYLKLGDGYKINKVTTLKDNLKMRLKVKNLRILAPIEGEDAFGIEIPNAKRDIVGLRFLLCSEEFNSESKGIRVAMGETFDGKPYIANLAKMPHLLVAGATGTGKSVFLNSVIISILYKYSPEDVRLIMIDPKRVEMSIYKGLPNLLVKDPVKEAKHAVNALKWLTEEMDRRYSVFESVGCRDIDEYNEYFRDKETEPKMPKIVLIIDEMADLMMTSKNSVEECVVRIAQLARACGIHMIIATQRPSVKVITGLIKANILHRVAFTVKSNTDSRVIMDDGGAEDLLGNGDMLYSFPANLLRLQGALVETPEIQEIVKYIKDNNEAYYDESIINSITYEPPAPAEESTVSPQELRDADFEHLLRVVLKRFIMDGRASVSSVQTVHGVGYLKAKKLVDAMEERGFLGPQDGAKPRDILITLDEFRDIFGDDMEAEGSPTIRDLTRDAGGEDE